MGDRETGNARPLKITIVGDGTVGKTCMLYSYANNSFPEEYVPTVFDNLAKTVVVDGTQFSLTLWDTAGQEEYERLRPLSYPKTDCFLLCYAIDNQASFENIEIKWIHELRHHCPTAAIVLVATKSDLRCDLSPNACITTADAKRLKSKIKANALVECSARTQQNLARAFEDAVRVVTKAKKGPSRSCKLL